MVTDSTVPVERPVESHSAASGVDALAFAGQRLGVEISSREVSQRFGLTREDLSAADLVQLARRLGLKATNRRLGWGGLVRLPPGTVAVVLLTRNRAMLYAGADSDPKAPKLALIDPTNAGGRATLLDRVRFERVWTGDVIILGAPQVAGPQQPDEAAPNFSMRTLFQYVLRDRAQAGAVLLSSVCISALSLVPPMLYLLVLDRILTYRRMGTLVTLTALVVLVLVFEVCLAFARRHMVARLTYRLDLGIGTELMTKLLRLPPDMFDRTPAGVITYKVQELHKIRSFVSGAMVSTLLDLTTLAFLLPVLFVLNVWLALVVVIACMLMAVMVASFLPAMRRAYSVALKAEHQKSRILIETVNGMRTVKSMAIGGIRLKAWQQAATGAADAHSRLLSLSNWLQSALLPFERGIYAGSLILGAYIAITNQGLDRPGALVAFTMLTARVIQPFVQLAQLLQHVHEARGSVEQLATLMNQPAERPAGALLLKPRIYGELMFDDVSYSYGGQVGLALDRVSFTIEEGTIVGITGRSGSGKTTLLRLIQGLSPDYQGSIRVDGTELREIEPDHLRSRIATVLQDSFLFSGTIAENIAIGRWLATPEEITEAARQAGIHEFISTQPRGYQTQVEEGGRNLSGGQRQRIAIARALIMNAPVLVLDESTSALDAQSERQLNAHLSQIGAGRTVIMVSHRLNALVGCDKIIVLEGGKIAATGTHLDLLDTSPVYQDLWKAASGSTAEESAA